MARRGAVLWIFLMWTCYGIAMAGVVERQWWIVGGGWLAGTLSAARS